MLKVKVKKLDEKAALPEVAHNGEDLGIDVFALEDTEITYTKTTRVRTGIALSISDDNGPWGTIAKDRGSMAGKNVRVSAGVNDAGYTGEIFIMMNTLPGTTYKIHAGDKIAQLVPLFPEKFEIEEVEDLGLASERDDNGFGSTGTKGKTNTKGNVTKP